MLDLTVGPSFKVKRWFAGFEELSFQWIQICNGSLMPRSSYVFPLVCLTLIIFNKYFINVLY